MRAGSRAIDPRTGHATGPEVSVDDEAAVSGAVARGEAAFDIDHATSPDARARFLETIADALGSRRAEIVPAAIREFGPAGGPDRRRTRTHHRQMCLFAATLRRGDRLGVRLDPALPDRAPLPRPDPRLRRIPVGPVAVFGAGNFPLAFSVAGGDIASALSAGCPVVVRGHPAHPDTRALVATAINEPVGLS